MKNKMMRVMSKLTATAMVASMFVTAMPVAAEEGFESISDTLSRQQVSETSVTHDVEFVANKGNGAWVNGETITLDYHIGGTGFTIVDGALGDATLSLGTASVAAASNVVTITCNAAECDGTVTLPQFTATNPASAGSYEIVVGGTSEYGTDPLDTDSFIIPIVDDDQVTVTASIESTMTFDLDTTISDANGDHESSAPYTVDLGTLSAASVSSSDDSGINSIWVDLTHNATGGAIVTVTSANGSLQSISQTGDEIVSTSGSYSAGDENYGLCIDESWDGGTNDLFLHTVAFGNSSTAGDNTVGCEAADHTDMGQLTTSAQTLLFSDGPLYQGTALLRVKAGISDITPAHPDYADTLTFIATATF
jgi:hypothetical protein